MIKRENRVRQLWRREASMPEYAAIYASSDRRSFERGMNVSDRREGRTKDQGWPKSMNPRCSAGQSESRRRVVVVDGGGGEDEEEEV